MNHLRDQINKHYSINFKCNEAKASNKTTTFIDLFSYSKLNINNDLSFVQEF